MTVVVDTAVIIDYLRTNSETCLFLQLVKQEYQLAASIITPAELFSGKTAQSSGKQRQLIEQVIGGLQLISPTLNTARLAGELRFTYQLSLADAFIAALALEISAPLATLDQKAFGKIKNLHLYSFTE